MLLEAVLLLFLTRARAFTADGSMAWQSKLKAQNASWSVQNAQLVTENTALKVSEGLGKPASSRKLFIDCEHTVQPIDIMPLRTSQASHTVLARQAMNRHVVEIGASQGDCTMCLAVTAHHVDAIEISNSSCAALARRRDAAGLHFTIHCSNFSDVPMHVFARAHFITWWIGGLKVNLEFVGWLYTILEKLMPNVEVVLLHTDAHIYDWLSFKVFRPLMSWVNESAVPSWEKQLCCESLGPIWHIRTNSHWTCASASGSIHIAGIPLMHRDLLATLNQGWTEQAQWPKERVRSKGGYPGNYKRDQVCRLQGGNLTDMRRPPLISNRGEVDGAPGH